jgi:hypothetical protein
MWNLADRAPVVSRWHLAALDADSIPRWVGSMPADAVWMADDSGTMQQSPGLMPGSTGLIPGNAG